MAIPNPIVIDVDVGSDVPVIPMTVTSDVPVIGMSMSEALNVKIRPTETYDGDYVIIPSQEEQVLQTQNLLSTDNFTIKPIPSNYGLISWNGSVLTVT